MELIENRTFDEIKLGDTASLVRTLTGKDIELFAVMSGDVNPTHGRRLRQERHVSQSRRPRHVGRSADFDSARNAASGSWDHLCRPVASFHGSVGLGDTITVTVTVTRKIDTRPPGRLRLPGRNQRAEKVITGTAEVIAPTEKIIRPRIGSSRGRVAAQGATLPNACSK